MPTLEPFPSFRAGVARFAPARATRAVGLFAWLAGQVTIVVQAALADVGHWDLARVWSSAFWNISLNRDPLVLFIVIVLLVGCSLLSLVPAKPFQVVMLLVYSVLFPASFYMGGGWYIGGIAGMTGMALLAITPALGHRPALPADGFKALVGFSIIGCIVACTVVPYSFNMPLMAPYYFNTSVYPGQSGPPNENNTLYILPIWENWDTYEADVGYFLHELDTGSPHVRVGFSASCWYMGELKGAADNHSFDPAASLHAKLNFSAAHGLPVLFHMNGGNWGTEGWKNVALPGIVTGWWMNDSLVQWDQFNKSVPAEIAQDQMPLKPRLFSLSRHSPVFALREQNVKLAGAIIAAFAAAHPGLLVGVSLDSEIHLETTRYSDFDENVDQYKSYYDYNPMVIAEFQEWLAIEHGTAAAVNARFGTSFPSLDAVDPPRAAEPGNAWWEEWTRFRIDHVKQNVMAQARWLAESGIPRDRIYTHQILSEPGSASARYERCDPLETTEIEHGTIGITRYGLISPSVFKDINRRAGFNWGIFEWNIWSATQNTVQNYLFMLKSMYQFGARVICPYAWYEFTWPELQIRNNTNFKQAIRAFSALVGDVPRATSFNGFLSTFDLARMFTIEAIAHFNKAPGIYYLLVPLVGIHAVTWPVLARLRAAARRRGPPAVAGT